MPSLPNLFTLVTLLCVTSIYSQKQPSQELRSNTREWSLAYNPLRLESLRQTVYLDEIGNNFLYSYCQGKVYRQICNVTLEIYEQPDVVHNKTCSGFEVVPYDSQRYILQYFTYWSSALNRAIFYAYENFDYSKRPQLRLRILNLGDCKYKEVIVPLEREIRDSSFYAENLFIANNTLELIVRMPTELCPHEPWCRFNIDQNGRLFGILPFYFDHFQAIISPRPGRNGFYVSAAPKSFDGLLEVSYGEGIGAFFKLTDRNKQERIRGALATSNLNGVYSVCGLAAKKDGASDGSKSIICVQVLEKAPDAPKLNFDVALESPSNVTMNWLGVRSLADGGLILVSGHCDKLDETKRMDCKSFEVVRAEADGSRRSSLEMQQLDFKCIGTESPVDAHIEESQEEFCFYFQCKDEEPDKGDYGTHYLRYRKACFPKSDILITQKS